MEGAEGRAKAVAAALNITENTPIAPSQYELSLLAEYVRGLLTIDEVIVLLEEKELLKGESEVLISGGE